GWGEVLTLAQPDDEHAARPVAGEALDVRADGAGRLGAASGGGGPAVGVESGEQVGRGRIEGFPARFALELTHDKGRARGAPTDLHRFEHAGLRVFLGTGLEDSGEKKPGTPTAAGVEPLVREPAVEAWIGGASGAARPVTARRPGSAAEAPRDHSYRRYIAGYAKSCGGPMGGARRGPLASGGRAAPGRGVRPRPGIRVLRPPSPRCR